MNLIRRKKQVLNNTTQSLKVQIYIQKCGVLFSYPILFGQKTNILFFFDVNIIKNDQQKKKEK